MSESPRILIVKLSAIGDCLHATPVVQVLREAMPTAHLAWAVHDHCSSVVEGNPFLDAVHRIPRKRLFRQSLAIRRELAGHKFDIALDLQGLLKSAWVARLSGARRIIGPSEAREGATWLYTQRVPRQLGKLHVIDGYLELAAAAGARSGSSAEMLLPLRDSDQAKASHLLPDGPRYVILNPSAGRMIKQWSPERFATVGEQLRERHNVVPVITGAPNDRPLADAILSAARHPESFLDLCGRTSLTELGAVIQRAALFIGGDTGPMHMAQAVGTPTLAIFGPTDPDTLGPRHSPHRVASLRVSCSPCRHRECPIGHICLKDLSVEHVLAQAESILCAAPSP